MTLSELERLSKIFNDTKRRAVSLRQLSFLLLDIVTRSRCMLEASASVTTVCYRVSDRTTNNCFLNTTYGI